MEYLTFSEELKQLFKSAFPEAVHAPLHTAIDEGEAGHIFDRLREFGGEPKSPALEYPNFNEAQNDAAARFDSFYGDIYRSK